jgi:DNA processing protein
MSTVGIECVHLGDADYPPVLAGDHQPPEVLYFRGSLGVLAARRVAIVGTRRCTHYGRQVATQLGRELARAGVVVVSGLALGIDGAAHTGALAARGAPVVGVVGSGLDVVYPKAHRRLWDDVAARGVLVSEAPPGAPPEPWRFPARNRIIAALAEAVIVIESHPAGGSNHTVAAAIDRSVPVLAVPGPITSSASAGTNRLLVEGCAPVTHVDDVLTAIGLAPTAAAGRAVRDPRPPPDSVQAQLLAAVGWSPTSFEQLALRTSLTPPQIAVALNALEETGWLRCNDGWWERLATPRVSDT